MSILEFEAFDLIVVDVHTAHIVSRKGPGILIKTPNSSYFSQTSHEEKRKQQYGYMSWINEMMDLLSDLMNLVSTTIAAWEEFEKRHVDLFPVHIFTSMTNIGDTFSGMRRLRLKMSKLKEKLLDNRNAVSTWANTRKSLADARQLIAYLSVENNDVAKFVKVLTAMKIVSRTKICMTRCED